MLFILPGMGATSAMYQGPWLNLNDTVFVDWPEMKGPINLETIASAVIQKYGISHGDMVGGSSLGGIISLEIAHQLILDKVILIGSAITKEEMNHFLRVIAPLVNISPMKLIQKIAGSSGHLGAMFSQTDADFIRKTCLELPSWGGYTGDLSNVFRIHGQADQIIKCPKSCRVIPGGGHLIAMTHANQCAEFVNGIILGIH